MSGVVIVGAGLGGLRTAEQLRARGFAGELTVVGAERHLPYNRPPLSKDLLSKAPATLAEAHARVAFGMRDTIADARFVTGVAAVASSLARREVTLADGEVLRFDGLVVSSGLQPRRLPLAGREQDRLVLRTVDDAMALRQRLAPGTRVVVIGGGFIGCEVAATSTGLGCQVTVVEYFAEPLERALGRPLGAGVRAYHEAHGIAFRTGRGVVAYGDAVVLDDGEELPADVIVEAVGSVPATAWLQGNDLDLADGVLCDDRMRVAGADGVVAVGDIARVPQTLLGGLPRRIEHWSVPGDTARRAAATLAAQIEGRAVDDEPFEHFPTFWSDQGDLRLQAFGLTGGDDQHILEGSPDDVPGGVAVAYLQDETVIGVATAGMTPRASMAFRRLVGEPVASS